MENEKQKKILFALIPIVIALLSFFVIARFTSSTEFNAKTIQSLDDKKTIVMELAAASTAASAAITLIPGDVGTPPSLTVEKQKNGCKASKINACSRFLFRNDMCYCAIFFTLW